jgi:hypothetical protein
MSIELSFHDGLIAACTLVGPVLAVQAQKWIERAAAKRNRKKALFEALMAARGETLSIEFKRAVNMIELVFHDDKKVINAWHNLFDTYVEQASDDSSARVLNEKRTDALKELLKQMSTACGYDFDDRTISKGYYTPVAHANLEDEQRRFRQGLVSLVEGKSSIRTEQVVSDSAATAQSDAQKKIIEFQEKLLANQEKLLGLISSDGRLKVRIIQDT